MSFRLREGSSRSRLNLVVAGRALSLLGDQVATVALVLRAQSHGGGAAIVAALLMANLVPMVVLSGLAGRVIDRVDNRRVIALATTLQATICAGLAFVTPTAVVLVGVALLGVGQAFAGTALQALVPSLVPADQLSRAIARSQAATTVALIAAPGLGGLLFAAGGVRGPLFINAASFVVVAIIGVCVGNARELTSLGAVSPDASEAATPRTTAEPAQRPRSSRTPGAWRLVASRPMLASTIGLVGVTVMLGSMVNVAEVFLVRESLHAGAAWYGAVGSAYAVGMFAGAVSTGRIRMPSRQARALVVSSIILGVGLAGMGLAPTVALLLVISAVAGSMNGALNVASSSLTMGAARPAERGRVAAVSSATVSGAQLIAFAVAAPLTTTLGPRGLFVLAGVLAALAPLAVRRHLVRAVRAGSIEDDPAPAAAVTPGNLQPSGRQAQDKRSAASCNA